MAKKIPLIIKDKKWNQYNKKINALRDSKSTKTLLLHDMKRNTLRVLSLHLYDIRFLYTHWIWDRVSNPLSDLSVIEHPIICFHLPQWTYYFMQDGFWHVRIHSHTYLCVYASHVSSYSKKLLHFLSVIVFISFDWVPVYLYIELLCVGIVQRSCSILCQ